ncbi:MFS transporter, partial [Escherichia coli]
GLGLGLLVGGPLSDALGRKPVITAGFALYALAAVAAIFADSLDLLLAARFVQGIGAAAPRIVALAMVRDLYQGREMARITSFVM